MRHLEQKQFGRQTTSYVIYAYMNDMFDQAEKMGAAFQVPLHLQKAAVARSAIDHTFAYISTMNESDPFVAERLWREIEAKAASMRNKTSIKKMEA